MKYAKRRHRVLIVNPPTDYDIQAVAAANQTCFPPMGIISLATRVNHAFSDIEVAIIDGGITSQKHILEFITSFKPNILGVSVLTPTYRQGLQIAEFAKGTCGSKVILGNDHASFFPELILSRHQYVDYVIQNDLGEIPFMLLVGMLTNNLTLNLDEIPSLYYLHGKNTQYTFLKKYSMLEVFQSNKDIPDIGLLDDNIQVYADNYNARFGSFHAGRSVKPITINNVRGCGNTARCAYCSILDLTLNCGQPAFFWDTVEIYHKHFGINFFFEVCDSFTTFRKYISELIEKMPSSIKDEGIEFMIYARAYEIAREPTVVSDLVSLNIKRVNIGLDAGSQRILATQRKGHAPGLEVETNKEAVRLLKNVGIQIHASFIAGALGETKGTLKETVDYVKELAGMGICSTIEFSRQVPLPNSPVWDLFIMKEYSHFFPNGVYETLQEHGIEISDSVKKYLQEKYNNQDKLDVMEMTEDWIKYFTHIDNDYAMKVIEEVDEMLKAEGIITGVNVA